MLDPVPFPVIFQTSVFAIRKLYCLHEHALWDLFCRNDENHSSDDGDMPMLDSLNMRQGIKTRSYVLLRSRNVDWMCCPVSRAICPLCMMYANCVIVESLGRNPDWCWYSKELFIKYAWSTFACWNPSSTEHVNMHEWRLQPIGYREVEEDRPS